MQPNEKQRETVVYKQVWFSSSSSQYQKDLKKRQKAGWQLISCTETGRDLAKRIILTAIYERA